MVFRAFCVAILLLTHPFTVAADDADGRANALFVEAALMLTRETDGPAERLETLTAALAIFDRIVEELPSSDVAVAIVTNTPMGDIDFAALRAERAGLAQEAAREPTKEYAKTELILDLADRILTQRRDLPGFGASAFGAEAAYLWLRYRRPDPDEALGALNRIAGEGRRPPRELDELIRAYAISTFGYEEARRILGPKLAAAFLAGDAHGTRAIFLEDDGARAFALLEEAKSGRQETGSKSNLRPAAFSAAFLLDIAEDRTRAIADRAERAGELALAATLLASLSDLGPYHALVAWHRGDSSLETWNPDASGVSVIAHAAPIAPLDGQTFQPMPETMRRIFRAGLLIGEADFLNILFNQTGWEREIADAAGMVLLRIEAGESGDAAANWLLAYDAISAQVSAEAIQSKMAGFSVSTGNFHYANSAQDTIDWMRAIRNIRPYMVGDAHDPPARSALLSGRFDWPAWVDLAATIRNGRTPPSGPDAAKMAVELYWTAGDPVAAAAFAEAHLPLKERLSFFRDAMKRLDRGCASFTAYPGQSILLGGATLFRFE